MNIKILAGLSIVTATFAACDDNTDNIGSSLIDNVDKLEITTDTFTVTTRSMVADSVLSRNVTGYLGKVRDPETGAYLTSDFMTQFYCSEDYAFPDKNNIQSRINGEIVADSCDIRLYYNEFYGDSLSTMKLVARELERPVEESKYFYTNFDPAKEGYLSANGIKKECVYTLTDLSVSESKRNGSDYIPSIRIPLDMPYKGYNNFGTYIINEYYKNPSAFKDAHSFINNVVPGFYFMSKSGLGSMAYVSLSQLNVYFRNKTTTTDSDGNKRDTIVTSVAAFPGTEEVLQTTNIANDKEAIRRLAADNTCTYLKTPAGIFTEMTLPVEEIVGKHPNDTINTAKVVLTRINNTQNSAYTLKAPQTLLMLPVSDMYTFFEKNELPDYKTSYLATYNSSDNAYTFNNIGGLIRHLHQQADHTSKDWNKVVIIPVSTTYSVVQQKNVLVNVAHDMSMTATRLVGGTENPNGDIKISVIYSKFK